MGFLAGYLVLSGNVPHGAGSGAHRAGAPALPIPPPVGGTDSSGTLP